MRTIKVTIGETVFDATKKKNVVKTVGMLDCVVPTIEDFGLSSQVETDEDGKTRYADSRLQWLQEAIEASVQATLRSRLVPKSVEYKKGHSAWTNVEGFFKSLTATLPKGAHFTLLKEWREYVTKWLSNKPLSEGKKAKFFAFLTDTKLLIAADEAVKNAVNAAAVKLAEEASADDVLKFDKFFMEIEAACSEEKEDEDISDVSFT